MTYGDALKAGAGIIAGLQKQGIDPPDSFAVLLFAFVLMHRTSNVRTGIEETAEAVRQAMIKMDEKIPDGAIEWAFERISDGIVSVQ